MRVADLKTAAEVRAHAREVQRRIKSRPIAKFEPKPEPPKPPPLVIAPPPKPVAKPPTSWWRPLDDQTMRAFPLKAVLRAATIEYGISFSLMRSPKHDQATCEVRQAGFFVAVHMLRASFSAIGRAARRDHTTVSHDYRIACERLANADALFAARIDSIGRRAAELLRREWRPVRFNGGDGA
jgi:hypothetical protein